MLPRLRHATLRLRTRSLSSSASSSTVRPTPLASLSPSHAVDALLKEGVRRAFVVHSPDRGMEVSHPAMESVAAFMRSNDRDYDEHEGVFWEVSPCTNTLLTASVHKTSRGPGAGGVRFWPYGRVTDAVADGLRLARGMGRKNALAGLWWGGGKGVMVRPPGEQWRDRRFRNEAFQEYGRFVTGLRGCYYTAEDVGATTRDMAEVFRGTRFTTCVPEEVGGSGNPSPHTALGVVCAMEGAADFVHGNGGSLAGMSVAVQGLGNVARPMIDRLLERGVARVVATDVNPRTVDEARAHFAGAPVEVALVAHGDCSVLFEDVDVASPCALGGVLNADTIPRLRAKIVAGAANNQLLDDTSDDALLQERGVVFVPDYVANRMGIVNCANEGYGRLDDDPFVQRHFGREWENSIFRVTKQCLERARRDGVTSEKAAQGIADELAGEAHPMWPDRSRQIIRSLVDGGWHLDGPLRPPYEV